MKDNFNDIYQYDDIINLPHHKPAHAHPCLEKNGSTVFFFCTKGYEDTVNETTD